MDNPIQGYAAGLEEYLAWHARSVACLNFLQDQRGKTVCVRMVCCFLGFEEFRLFKLDHSTVIEAARRDSLRSSQQGCHYDTQCRECLGCNGLSLHPVETYIRVYRLKRGGRLDLDLFNRTIRPPMTAKGSRKKPKSPNPRELDVEITFLEGLIRRDPAYVDALQLLGDDYTQRGRYEDGLQVDQKLAELEPNNPLSFYNLACSFSLIGKLDEAFRAMESALDLGYRDFKWMARDPDLKALRKHPQYARLREKIRRLKFDVE